jgi:hypothetical protein
MVALHAHEEACVHAQGFHIGFSSPLTLRQSQAPRLLGEALVLAPFLSRPPANIPAQATSLLDGA